MKRSFLCSRAFLGASAMLAFSQMICDTSPNSAATLILTLGMLTMLTSLPAVSAQFPSAARGEQEARSGALIGTLVDQLGKVRTPTTSAISPDGAFVAWTIASQDGSGDELHLTGLSPTGPQDPAWDRILSPDSITDVTNLRPGICPASHPAWSPDGRILAFLSACQTSGTTFAHATQQNIFLYTLATNAMRQLTYLHGNFGSPQWSPDSKTVGFLFTENATRKAGALDAMKPWAGVIGEDGVELQRAYGVQLRDGQSARLTPEKLHIYEFSWAPSSKAIAYIGANPPGENTWWIAKLYSQKVTLRDNQPSNSQSHVGMETAATVCFDPAAPGPLHNLQLAVPRFSPDGKTIAFIAGLMSDQGSTGGDIYLIPAAGLKPNEEPRDLTPNRQASPAWITWLDSHTLGVSEHTGGTSHLTALNVETGRDDPAVDLTLPETIIAGADVMSVSFSKPAALAGLKTVTAAFIRQSFVHGPEVWAGPLDDLKQMTHLNDTIKPLWGKAESIEYENAGFHIQGWLLYPVGWNLGDDANGKRYPLVVNVHGGPSSAVTPRWPTAAYGAVPFSALGYFVFMPNPRGSFGQGEKFTQANIKSFGEGDFSDVLAGMDVIEKRFPIDKEREGLTGWSYGGFMTMFGVTQTTRFRAAVAGAGISNWQSYYGENSIDQWMVPFFGATVYDDPKVYAKSSAINFIQQVKTPTLVVVGDRDGECPAPQSFEFWHALKAEGIKTKLVIYPNEGHRFVDPEHQRDVLRRALDWFETEMPAK